MGRGFGGPVEGWQGASNCKGRGWKAASVTDGGCSAPVGKEVTRRRGTGGGRKFRKLVGTKLEEPFESCQKGWVKRQSIKEKFRVWDLAVNRKGAKAKRRLRPTPGQ